MKRAAYLFVICILLAGILVLSLYDRAPAGSFESPPQQEATPASPPTPGEVIAAVNALRVSHGLPPLNPHPILMRVAQEEAEGIAAGLGGHWRPNNMTLGQWLISLGYPLSGDLSQDGYRSENWVAASTTEDAIAFWLSDDEHTNTMLSPNRSDIGAAVAVGDQIYVVIETALQTSSGQMQYDAYPILTGIPATQTAYYSLMTEAAQYGILPQYSVPVIKSTARPDGDVIHEVQYGQTLWSIAIQYGTTIEQIRRLNNLSLTPVIYPGQKLLIQKNATQPAPTVGGTEAGPHPSASMPPPTIRATFTAIDAANADPAFMTEGVSASTVLVVVVAFLILAGVFVLSARKRIV
ncbi:MAG: LysM peptidoglycan-binding domain-containing protein [Chloroflexota bacterium]